MHFVDSKDSKHTIEFEDIWPKTVKVNKLPVISEMEDGVMDINSRRETVTKTVLDTH